MKKKRTIPLPSQQQIDDLVSSGNIEELRALNEKLAKTANQRMSQLYQSGIKETEALKRAKYYTEQVSEIQSGGVFSRSKKLTLEQYAEQISEELIFLRSETSTVTGTKQERAEKSFEALTEGENPYLEIPENIEVPGDWQGSKDEYFKEKFFKFLETDAWKDIKKFLYSTDTNILQKAGEAIARGANVKDLVNNYKNYLKGETSIFSMWDDWISI